jgi:poly(A) RNA polymerase GLD2
MASAGLSARIIRLVSSVLQGGPAVSEKTHLEKVRKLLRRYCSHAVRPDIELIPAKVPILKFRQRNGGLEVDLCVNNPTSIRNTHLLFYYSKCDIRDESGNSGFSSMHFSSWRIKGL